MHAVSGRSDVEPRGPERNSSTARLRFSPAWHIDCTILESDREKIMSITMWLLVIVVLFVLFGGGGGYYWSRSRR